MIHQVHKKNRSSYYPWLVLGLLGAWPFLSFLDHNQDDAPFYWASLTSYGVIFVVFLFALTWFGGKLLGKDRRAQIANTLGIGSVCLFSYLTVSGPLSQLGISLGTVKIAIWLVTSLVLMGLTWRLSSHSNTSLVLLVIAAALVFIPAMRLTLFVFEASRINAATPPSVTMPATVPSKRPNIYWIILDGYPRADVLKDYFGYRNDEFVQELRKRRFFVAKQSFSNYASTKLSISTTGNMDYYLTTEAPLHPKLWTARLQGFNHVVDRFLAKGYGYVHAGPGGNNGKTRCGGREVLCVTSASDGRLNLNEADVGLLRLTAIYPMVRTLFPGLINFDFNDLDNMSAKLTLWPEPPVFSFIHILSPHPPPRYKKDCAEITEGSLDLVGEDESSTPATFLNDMKCLNPKVVDYVDFILANDPSDPIILIQGDHGYRGDENELPAPARSSINRRLIRYANLNAIRLPERCADMARDDITSVNTFRLVFTCLGDTDLPQVVDKLFAHDKKKVWALEIN